MLEILTTAVILLLALIPLFWYLRRVRSSRDRAREKWKESIETGRTEPVSLHPFIDPNICIGTAACVPACPEGDILGIIDGRGQLVEPGNCIGHGECFRACPVDAISLVFGTEKRGVDIPHLREDFETNVPGIHIVGELGGMGLIRNAVTQGREVIEYVTPALKKSQNNGVTDVAIVGAGPAGLSAAARAIEMGLSYVVLEQDQFGGAILSYPRQKIVMTQSMDIPIYGTADFQEISKEDLLELWVNIIDETGMQIQEDQKVQNVQRVNGHHRVITPQDTFDAQKVILAIGRRGTPRKLGVPGEDSSKVTYRLLEPEQYAGERCLVVGGGDSAVEAALNLSEQPGTDVTISYRKDAFGRVKKKNLQRVQRALDESQLKVIWESNVTAIHAHDVDLEQNNETLSIENSYVFIFIGGVVPTPFLQKLGVEVEKKFGEA